MRWLLTVHAEDDTITNTLRNRLTKEELLPIGHALTRPNTAESISVNTVIGLARVVGDAPVYLVHMSAHESLSEIRLARQEGQANIYAETCPQYLFLTDDKFKDGGPMEGIKYMLAPPLRKKKTKTRCGRAYRTARSRWLPPTTVHLPLLKSKPMWTISEIVPAASVV